MVRELRHSWLSTPRPAKAQPACARAEATKDQPVPESLMNVAEVSSQSGSGRGSDQPPRASSADLLLVTNGPPNSVP